MNINNIIKELKEDKLYDYIVIDQLNVILVLKQDDYFILIHEKIEDTKLTRKYVWTQKSYTKELNHANNILSDNNLILVEGEDYKYDSVYNYQKAKFIVRKGNFNSVEKLTEKSSEISDKDATKILFIARFNIYEEPYFTLIDEKGNIIKSLIYKGYEHNYSRILNLNNYGSLEVFKLLVEESKNELKKH